MKHNSLQNKLRIIAIILLFIVAINALGAGYSFIVEPSGNDIGISTNYLKYSPFKTFLIPGIILFIANGILNLTAAIISIRKLPYYPYWLLFQGLILLGWAVIQVIPVRDFNFLHLTCLIIALVLILIGKYSLKPAIT